MCLLHIIVGYVRGLPRLGLIPGAFIEPVKNRLIFCYKVACFQLISIDQVPRKVVRATINLCLHTNLIFV